MGLRADDPPAADKEDDPRWIKLAVKGQRFEMEFARIPKGKFTMGSPKGEKYRQEEEIEHEVEITRDYWLGKTEVTVGQFRAFVADTGYQTDAEKGNGSQGWDGDKRAFVRDKRFNWRSPGFQQTDEHPVVCLSWNDAKAFCDWLAKKSGRPTRLPTEAEWERACRGGTQTSFHFGDDEEDLRYYANVADASFRKATKGDAGIKGDDGHAFTAPVRSLKPNAYGLYGMHGNASEWCADQFRPYTDIVSKKDPESTIKAGEGANRVIRGGGWCDGAWYCRAAFRGRAAPSERYIDFGLRVAIRLD
jgi:formylglycine-generating enzyme required for sulfatase activity